MANKKWWLVYLFLSILLISSTVSVYAKKNTLNVTITEAVAEKIAYNPERGEYSTGNATWNSSYVLKVPSLVGTINITNVGSEDLSNLNVTLNGTTNLAAWPTLWSSPSYVTPVRRTLGVPGVGQDWWVYAAVLKPGGSLIFNYTLTILNNEPVNITESYSANKMIEGGSFRINITVENSLTTPVNVSNVKIIKTPGRYYNQAGSYVYFNYTSVSGPDSANVDFIPYNGVSRMIWNVSALSNITPRYLGGARNTILLNVTVPRGLNGTFPTTEKRWRNQTWGAYLLIGDIIVNVTMEGSVSTMGIRSVLGTSTATMEVQKTRLNSTHWNTSAKFNNTASTIDYNLTRITIWSINYTAGSFNPSSAGAIAGSLLSSTPVAAVANGSVWAGLSRSFAWNWVPIVWANATYRILDDGTQIKKVVETRTVTNGYLYIEEIFVLKGGYLIKVTKQIKPITLNKNAYNVTLLLENIGSEKTPDWVSMFDLIPPNFELLNVTNVNVGFGSRLMSGNSRYAVSQASQLRGVSAFAAIVGGLYNTYQGYRVDFRELMNGSDGDGKYDAVASEVRFNYMINGTGSLSRVSNAFLVGVDPQRTDGSVSSVSAPDTNVVVSSGKNVSAEKAVMFISLIIAMVALVAGFVLSRNTR